MQGLDGGLAGAEQALQQVGSHRSRPLVRGGQRCRWCGVYPQGADADPAAKWCQ